MSFSADKSNILNFKNIQTKSEIHKVQKIKKTHPNTII